MNTQQNGEGELLRGAEGSEVGLLAERVGAGWDHGRKAMAAEAEHGSRPTRCPVIEASTSLCCLREVGHFGSCAVRRVMNQPSHPELLDALREAPQGATGTAQPIAATLEEKPLSDEEADAERLMDAIGEVWCDYGVHGLDFDAGEQPSPPKASGYLDHIRKLLAEGSPQPAEPRTGASPCEHAVQTEHRSGIVTCDECGARLVDPFAAEGGDTLTPETPLETAQPSEFHRLMAHYEDLLTARRLWEADKSEVEVTHAEVRAANNAVTDYVDRLEAQAARIAAARQLAAQWDETADSLFDDAEDYADTPVDDIVMARAFRDCANALRAALVGEEAP